MRETRSADGKGGAVDEVLLLRTRSGPAEPAKVPILAELRTSFAAYRKAEARAMVRVCVAAAHASTLRTAYWMAHSQRDYTGAVLGVKQATFCRWVKVGRLLVAHPELREHVHAGRLNMKRLVQLASDGGAKTGESKRGNAASDGGADTRSENSEPEFVRLSIAAPVPAILYMEESLQLARGLVGTSASDEEALQALLAEAGTESSRRVDAALARRRFRVRDGGSGRAPAGNGNARAGDSGKAGNSAGIPGLAHLSKATQRRAALRMHGILARLVSRRARLRVRLEEKLYQWQLEGMHELSGFRNFERFAEEILGLAPGTCRDRLRHARQRRLANSIAVAACKGRITPVQAELLERMYRHCHVPSSDLERWCEYAEAHTVRRLRKAIAWAKRQADLDYRRWSLAHCRPPEDSELRTMEQSLETLVKDARTDTVAEALMSWEIAPKSVMRFFLSRETRDELLVQMASIQDEIRHADDGSAPRLVPEWLAVCRIFHRAREAWRVHHQAPPAGQRRILDRDGYLCAAPECTQRRNLQVHHVEYRSRGGDDRDGNRVTLCAFHHHHGEHGGLLRVRGQIDTQGRGLTWEMGLDEHGRAMRVYRDERVIQPQ